jgi:hypothetical protein
LLCSTADTLTNRGTERITQTFSHRLADPFTHAIAEAVAQRVGHPITDRIGEALRVQAGAERHLLGERGTNRASEPFAEHVLYMLANSVGCPLPHGVAHLLAQRSPDPLAELLLNAVDLTETAGCQPAVAAGQTSIGQRRSEPFLQAFPARLLETFAQHITQPFSHAFLNALADRILQVLAKHGDEALAVHLETGL